MATVQAAENTAAPLSKQGPEGLMSRAYRAAKSALGRRQENDAAELCRQVSESAEPFAELIEASRSAMAQGLLPSVPETLGHRQSWTALEVERVIGGAMNRLNRQQREAMVFWVLEQAVARREVCRITGRPDV